MPKAIDIDPPNPSGFCMCGCGELAPIAPQSIRSKGILVGHPMRYCHGHAGRMKWDTPEARKRQGQAFKKFLETNPHPMVGKTQSEETKRKIGDANRGERHGNYKGGRTDNGQGYWLVLVPEGHPLRLSKGYALEHRVVASEKIGRWVRPDEDVHHLNGDKRDNRPENLIVMPHAKHTFFHRVRMTGDEIAEVRALIDQGLDDKDIAGVLTMRRYERKQ